MNSPRLEYPNKQGVVFEEDKKRFEWKLSSDHGDGGSIIAYYPADSLQIFVYDIHTKHIPDLKPERSASGRYLRVNLCKSGRCELISKSSSTYLSGEEAAMEYGMEDDGSFRLETQDYVGVQIVMQIDQVITDFPLLALLKKAVKEMDLPEGENEKLR